MEILNSFGSTIIVFIFVLGVMIFVHELGHHLVAKWLGIRVLTFSLGFGPRLFGFRMGGTDYRVSALPLGGYVKMSGENVDDDLTGSVEEFLSRPKWQRFLVALAGPVMNLTLAVVIFAGNFMTGVFVPTHLDKEPLIGAVADDSPALEAGFLKGDVILEIDGLAMPTWKDVETQVATRGGQELTFVLQRGNRRIDKTVALKALPPSDQGYLGADPYLPFVVASVNEGSPSEEAGLQKGDRILWAEADGRRAEGFYETTRLVAPRDDQPILFHVERQGESMDITIAPRKDENGRRAFIGVVPDGTYRVEKYGFVESFGRSVQYSVEISGLLFRVLGQIITGKTSIRTLSGPIDIARISAQAAAQGAGTLITFMAFISLQLGILNLLPIPILDGGVIAMLAVEGLIGRDLSLRVKERILQVGFVFLILLMGFVLINDITKNL